MSIENIISSMQDCHIARCTFESSQKQYSYKVPKDWKVAEGDTLVIDAPSSGLTFVTVKEVTDNELDITVDYNYKWAVSKVDLTSYNERLEQEQLVVAELKVLRRKAQQKQALKNLLEDLGEEAEAVLATIRTRL